jgi:hypothetical protein
MKYLLACVVLGLVILYIVIRVPPSALSKFACVLLGLALLYCGSCAKECTGSRTWGEDSGMAEVQERDEE